MRLVFSFVALVFVTGNLLTAQEETGTPREETTETGAAEKTPAKVTLPKLPSLPLPEDPAASGETEKPATKVAPPPVTLPVISFRPKNSGTATLRFAKATRGDQPPVNIYTLTPARSCLTLSNQPTVFWYQDQKGKVRITLNDLDRKETLFSRVTPIPMNAGTHRMQLAETGVILKPGVNYEWSVMFIVSEDTPSSNPVARGTIVMVEPAPELQAQIKGMLPGVQRARILAEHGVFYDALADLSLVAGAHPARPELRTVFENFLQQTGARPGD